MYNISNALIIKVLLLVALFGLIQGLSRSRRDDKKEPADHKSKHWGYRNEDRSLLPKNWHKSHPKCYGQKQSPINIESDSSVYDTRLKNILIDYDHNDEGNKLEENENEIENDNQIWTIKNNGHSVVLSTEHGNFQFLMLPDNQTYKFLQMHFHWRGSEHFIDGHPYSAELHLVHQNVNDENKFAVLGFLFRISGKDNKDLEPITDALVRVVKFNAKDEIALKLSDLIPFRIKNYFRYSGSLTTPGCDEKVEWFVINDPVLLISEDQLLSFQDLEDDHGFPILSNSRPIQDLHDRSVKRSFNLKKEKSSKSKWADNSNDSKSYRSLFFLSSIYTLASFIFAFLHL